MRQSGGLRLPNATSGGDIDLPHYHAEGQLLYENQGGDAQ